MTGAEQLLPPGSCPALSVPSREKDGAESSQYGHRVAFFVINFIIFQGICHKYFCLKYFSKDHFHLFWWRLFYLKALDCSLVGELVMVKKIALNMYRHIPLCLRHS